jgi:hypothetical protein
MAVTYFSKEGLPGQFFRCEAYAADLSTMSCSGMYKAEKGRQNGRHPHCNGCAIGAGHAGEAAPTSTLFGAKFCPRCTRPAARIVKCLCVSCVNRQYELDRGSNAKGTAPSRLRPLISVHVAWSLAGDAKMTKFPKVVSRLEAVLRILQAQPGEVEFSWMGLRPDLPQLPLFTRSVSASPA